MDKHTTYLFFVLLSLDRKFCCINLAMFQRYSYRNMSQMGGDVVIMSTSHTQITRLQHQFSSRWDFILKSCENYPTQEFDLLNLEIQPYLLPSDNLNATFLPPRDKERTLKKNKKNKEKHFCVCVAGTCNLIAQQKSCGGKSPRRHYMSASPSYC